MLTGDQVDQLREMTREGLSIRAISELTGYDRKTVRKYLLKPETPEYGPRPARPSKLDPFKPYLEDRLKAGVWNGEVLLREIRARGYQGGHTILRDWLQPQRKAAKVNAVRRFETPPGQQAQVDWGHLGYVTENGKRIKLWGFVITSCYSRRLWCQGALDQRLGTLLRMHEAAFQDWGCVPEEILYDRMRTIWTGTDARGEIVWHPVFLDFARYWGFRPRLCQPYRAQTKGKIESGVKYVRRSFVCSLLGRQVGGITDFNGDVMTWTATVANQRVHGTLHQCVADLWEVDRQHMTPILGRPPYPYADDELRTVSRDAYVAWRASRYSVPWRFAGQQVWVREHGQAVEVFHGQQRIAVHERAGVRHQIVTQVNHHAGIPLGAERPGGKMLVEIRESAPAVDVRPLAAYEAVAGGAL